ncbi:MAG: nuclear transport factor 2 family protein [Gammaproteobacteria bacterium]
MFDFDVATRTRELYRLLTADFGAVVEGWLDAEFKWINYLPAHVPFGGVYEGAEGLRRYGLELMAAIELKPLHIEEIVVEGLTAVVVGVESQTRVLSTNKFYDMDWVHIVKYRRNGKLAYVREYNQIEAMAEAFRLK